MNILTASFPAEQSWADAGEARLSPLRVAAVDPTARSLDEVLFPLCTDGDVLCTRFPRNERLREYHASLGFRHAEHACTDDVLDPRETYALLESNTHAEWLGRAVAGGAKLVPWAVTRESATLLGRHGVSGHPPVDVVARVNSKIWSTELRWQINEDEPAVVASSSAELLQLGENYLQRYGSIVIKEPHGVSGRGTVRVDSERRLQQIADVLASQERFGRRVRMILEPFLKREFDFSVYLDVLPDGDARLVGLQEVLVSGFGWSAVRPMTPEHEAAACTPHYFAVIDEACRALHKEGYAGPVCIDSMALAGGGLLPLVEVNARLSLGRMNQRLDAALAVHSRGSHFSALRTSLGRERIGELLDALGAAGGLFGASSEEGIIPLSSNTLRAGGADEAAGRLYFSVPFRDTLDVERANATLRRVLEQLGAKVF